jgi:hypothetical protein
VNKTKRNKIIIISGALILLILLIIILLMQVSTNSVMRQVRDAFYSPDYYVSEFYYNYNPEAYADPNTNYIIYPDSQLHRNLYARYNTTQNRGTRYFDQCHIYLKLNRIFAWHNFKKGSLWFKYTRVVYDFNGNDIFGSKDIPVKLSIEKVNGQWEVVEIKEAP